MYMSVHDLNREQLIELKCDYMVQLVNEGTFREVTNSDCDEPSYGHYANADEIIPDDMIFEHYEGYVFTDEDFRR